MITSKTVHFVCGFYTAMLFGVIYTPRAGFFLAIALALLKEYNDQQTYGIYNWRNTIICWTGGALASFLVLLSAYF